MINKLVHGLVIGVALIIPGMSAGTAILLLGFYQEFIEDLSRFNFRPYLIHIPGALVGIFAGVRVIGFLLESYELYLNAFLLGVLVVSVGPVLYYNRPLHLRLVNILWGAAGFAAAWFYLCRPGGSVTDLFTGSLSGFFLAGSLAGATMLIPGVSGSAALIIINMYDDVILAVNAWYWPGLLVFLAGSLSGIFFLARIISSLYRRYRSAVSLFLAGLILGSTRIVFPEQINGGVFLAAVTGALIILFFSRPRNQC